MTPLPTRFTTDDADAANEAWGCNCGPGALAAILGRTLDEVRRVIPEFEVKRYTNLTMMVAALTALGASHRVERRGGPVVLWPQYGLCRIQWHGPWMKPGVPERARAGKTHWVGACLHARHGGVGIFDINAIGNGTGWVSLADWKGILVPFLTSTIRNADGGWHITHAIEVERPK